MVFQEGILKNKGAIEKSVYIFLEWHAFYVFKSPTQAWLVHTQTDLLLLRSKNQFKVLGSSTVQFQVEFSKICRDRNHQHIAQGVLNVIFFFGGDLGGVILLKISLNCCFQVPAGLDVMLPFTKTWVSFTLGFQTHCEEVFEPCVYPFFNNIFSSQYIVRRERLDSSDMLTCSF